MSERDGVTDRRSILPPSKQELLAKRLAASGSMDPLDRIGRRVRVGPFPLSFAQQRLWFLERLAPGGSAYNVPYAYRIRGEVSVKGLETALTEIVRRHEVLRTRFMAVDGKPFQEVLQAFPVNVDLKDLRTVGEDGREALALRMLHEEAHGGFDLERGPLMKVSVISLHDNDHLLVIVFHHIVFDGWSEGVFFKELSALYEASARGESRTLPELPIQYGDYVLWQREKLQGQFLEKQLAYWREQLGGDLPVLELAADRLRPGVLTHLGKTEFFTVAEPLYGGIRDLGRQEGVTLFMTLLSAFNLLLSRYTGQDEVIVGTPIAGRTCMEVEGLAGFFVNTLALRTSLKENPTFRELLKRTRDITLGAFEHQEVPFEKLVEELHPRRSPTSSPLFQAMFVLQSAPEGRVSLGHTIASKLDVTTDTAKFDVTLSMMERDGELVGWLQSSADLFELESIKRMCDHFVTLLRGIVEDPGRTIWQIPLMSEAEEHKITVEWNATRSDYPSGMTISGLFEEQVGISPDAIALENGPHKVTYRALNSRANRLARYLRAHGAGPGSIIGVAMGRSDDLIVGLLAILKTGGTYLPLEMSYPPDRIAFMLEDAKISLLLTQKSLQKDLPTYTGKVITIDTEREEIDREGDEGLPEASSPDGLAYVMYTSGSTGTPKGVCVTQRGVVRLVKSTDYAILNAGEVFLLFAPISFDASTFEIWGSLLNGAKLVIFPPNLPSLEELGRVIRESGITTMWLTSSLFKQMVDGPLDHLGGLRQLLVGGEVLPVLQVRKFRQRHPRCMLINCYGPTENTTFTTWYPITDENRINASVPIGRPIRNTRVYILDRYLQPVPEGIPGELYIAGDGLARGYLNRPELTAATFVLGPAGADPAERLYRTGDIVRYSSDGNIEFRGRADNQVKIRGFRIEIGEIEAVLANYPGLREAAVIVREAITDDRRLVGYCAWHEHSQGEPGGLRTFLKRKLPEYMIPSSFVSLETLPRTPSGKIDRAALADVDPAAGGEKSTAVMSPTEEALAGVFSRILGVERVGIDDDFFSLGGHSLLAMQVLSRIRGRWQIDLSLVSIFEHPTVRALARVIENKVLDQIEEMSDDEVSGAQDKE